MSVTGDRFLTIDKLRHQLQLPDIEELRRLWAKATSNASPWRTPILSDADEVQLDEIGTDAKLPREPWPGFYEQAAMLQSRNAFSAKAKKHVQETMRNWPHECPHCGGPALQLATSVDCMYRCR